MEQSFAEKLRIQAKDKKTAMFDDFIKRTVAGVKNCAQEQACEGHFKCEFTTDSMPDAILPYPGSGHEIFNQAILTIINTLRLNLDGCGFSTLLINRSYAYGPPGTSFAIVCKW